MLFVSPRLRALNGVHAYSLQRLEREDVQKKRELKKRRADGESPEKSSTRFIAPHPSLPRRPDSVVIDDDEESGHEDGNILYNGQREPLQGYSSTSPDSTRSPDKRQKTTPCPPSITPFRLAPRQAGRSGTAVSSTPATAAVTSLGNVPRDTVGMPRNRPPGSTSDAESTHSGPMSESDSTEHPVPSLAIIASNHVAFPQTNQRTLSPVVTNSPIRNEKDPIPNQTPTSTVSSLTTVVGEISNVCEAPSRLKGKTTSQPAAPVVTSGRSASLPVGRSTSQKYTTGGPPQTSGPMATLIESKAPLPLPHAMTQEDKMAEMYQEMAYLYQTRAEDSRRRALQEKTDTKERMGLLQQISELKRLQQKLEETVTAQGEQLATQSEQLTAQGEQLTAQSGELAKLSEQNEEKTQKLVELEGFRERLLDYLASEAQRCPSTTTTESMK
ncbi:hypothetical protein BJY01DRAFT_41091 [Aspergillus pseudoustus]|uniref:Uncharacterized protein n=1 Tax=Aspergillus pseudoustus TaxID=1810923 RepID=A0ABR4JCF4_9EURO